MAPMTSRFVRAHDELVATNANLAADLVTTRSELESVRVELGEVSSELEDTHRRIDRLTDEIAAANALAWDHVALSRRLAQIEDELALGTSRPDAENRAASGQSGF
jgi:uncharacterized coiled-coil DUF342 family protein